MEALTYVAPLRAAVLWCVGLRKGAVPVTTLAVIAEVDTARARAFASILLARGALAETPEGLVPGPEWAEWSNMESRARPKGHGAGVEDAMGAMRRRLRANVVALAAQRRWSALELARRTGVPHQYLYRLWRRGVPLPACALVLVARTLEVTVEELVAQHAPLGSGHRW